MKELIKCGDFNLELEAALKEYRFPKGADRKLIKKKLLKLRIMAANDVDVDNCTNDEWDKFECLLDELQELLYER